MPVLIDLPDLDNRDIVTFTYSASDPGNVTRAGSDATGYTYSPALGAMRLWAKDGPQSRKVGKIGECGDYGDWIAPGVEYSGSVIASALTQVSAGIYRAFLENVAGVDVTQIGVQRQTRTTGPATAASKTSGADLSLHTDWGSDRYIPEAIGDGHTWQRNLTWRTRPACPTAPSSLSLSTQTHPRMSRTCASGVRIPMRAAKQWC